MCICTLSKKHESVLGLGYFKLSILKIRWIFCFIRYPASMRRRGETVCSIGTIGGGIEMTKNMRRRGDKEEKEDLGRVVKLDRANG